MSADGAHGVSREEEPAPWSVHLTDRLTGGTLALATGMVLGLAVWLDPDPAGHGTHTQLGLQPCTFHTLTGVPCPLCGATTAYALMSEGRVVEAVVTQPFAAGLWVVTVAVFGVSVAEAVVPTGRWRRIGTVVSPWEGRLAIGVLVALVAGWSYKIVVMA